ncbi:MAG: hypothetical protein ACI8YQ_000193 [Polaribacter sp.]|jgi:hypothetical protein
MAYHPRLIRGYAILIGAVNTAEMLLLLIQSNNNI